MEEIIEIIAIWASRVISQWIQDYPCCNSVPSKIKLDCQKCQCRDRGDHFTIRLTVFVLKCNFRQEQFEQSAQGRAARAQMAAMSKQSAGSDKGEPVLKV